MKTEQQLLRKINNLNTNNRKNCLKVLRDVLSNINNVSLTPHFTLLEKDIPIEFKLLIAYFILCDTEDYCNLLKLSKYDMSDKRLQLMLISEFHFIATLTKISENNRTYLIFLFDKILHHTDNNDVAEYLLKIINNKKINNVIKFCFSHNIKNLIIDFIDDNTNENLFKYIVNFYLKDYLNENDDFSYFHILYKFKFNSTKYKYIIKKIINLINLK